MTVVNLGASHTRDCRLCLFQRLFASIFTLIVAIPFLISCFSGMLYAICVLYFFSRIVGVDDFGYSSRHCSHELQMAEVAHTELESVDLSVGGNAVTVPDNVSFASEEEQEESAKPRGAASPSENDRDVVDDLSDQIQDTESNENEEDPGDTASACRGAASPSENDRDVVDDLSAQIQDAESNEDEEDPGDTAASCHGAASPSENDRDSEMSINSVQSDDDSGTHASMPSLEEIRGPRLVLHAYPFHQVYYSPNASSVSSAAASEEDSDAWNPRYVFPPVMGPVKRIDSSEDNRSSSDDLSEQMEENSETTVDMESHEEEDESLGDY